MNRILCPVTLAASARGVIDWAAHLAAVFDAEVRLFHVLEGYRSEPTPGADMFVDDERVLSKLFSLASRVPGRPRVSAAVTQGVPPDEILRHARLVRADLIAIGTSEGAGMSSLMIRDMAVDAPCPVLVVPIGPERSTERCPRHIRQIVCAVNFLPASLAAVDYSFALGRKMGGCVTVVHVFSEQWEGLERRAAAVDETRDLVERHVRELLHIAVKDASTSWHDTSEVVVSGWPCVEIVRLAQRRAADLVVMGIDRERNGDCEATTACVLQFTKCPVLLVSAPAVPSRGRCTDRVNAVQRK